MKTRYGLVSNSSSSSFVIYKKDLSESQIFQILNWKTECQKYGMVVPDDPKTWKVEDFGNAIGFCSSVANFNMQEYLEKKLEISRDIIKEMK